LSSLWMWNVSIDVLLLHVVIICFTGIAFVGKYLFWFCLIIFFYSFQYGNEFIDVIGRIIKGRCKDELILSGNLRIVSISPVFSFHLHEPTIPIG
jgi:hypothetical protein